MFLQFSNKDPPMFLQFSNKDPPMFLQFSNKDPPMLLQFSNARKLQQHWGDIGGTNVLAVFERSKTATTLGGHWGDQCSCSFRTFENCNNIGGPMFLQFSNTGVL